MRNVLALLVMSAVAWSAPPVVTVPAEVTGDVGAFVAVRATVKDGKAVKFVAVDAGLNLFPADMLADKTATVVTSAKAGRYRLVCYSGNADGPSEPVTVTVVIGVATADPVKPNPTDVKKAEKVAVVVVEESMTRTVEQAKNITDVRKWCETSGNTLFVVDKDDPVAAKNGYLTHAKELPAVLVFDAKGGAGLLRVVKLDGDTVAKMKEVVK